jgi:uncharacterized membrane protein
MNDAVTQQANISTETVVLTEQAFSLMDIGILLLIIAAAFFYLYHKLWRKRGACPDCGQDDSHCTTKMKQGHSGEVHVPIDRIGRRSS